MEHVRRVSCAAFYFNVIGMKTTHANDVEVNPEFLPPDELWEMVEKLLPLAPVRPQGGRPPMPDKIAFYAIYQVLRAGIFLDLWRWCLHNYDFMYGLDWEWQAFEGAITKAPLGCENTGLNPTEHAKQGTKRHLLTDSHGIPLAIVVTGANRNAFKETRRVLEQIVIARPKPTSRKRQHLCLDKGYDYPESRSPRKEDTKSDFLVTENRS